MLHVVVEVCDMLNIVVEVHMDMPDVVVAIIIEMLNIVLEVNTELLDIRRM